ncbi:MAG: hypothetical protein ACRCVG_03495 [Methanobacteriaceae archaeon]
MTIINCTFLNNHAYYGGAIFNENGEINMYNSSFINNSAYLGGAIFSEGDDDGILPTSDSLPVFTVKTSINIQNNTFINNSAEYEGGAIFSSRNSNCSIFGSSFINNSAEYKGGAIFSSRNSNCSIFGSSFINNSAEYKGGAILNEGNFSFSYSNFVNNTGIALVNFGVSLGTDFNWWGDNTPEVNVDYLGINLFNWFVANLNSKNITLVNGSAVVLDYSFSLNDGSVADNNLLPYFAIMIGAEVFDARFNNSINYTVQSSNVNGFVDNQPLGVIFDLLYPDISVDLGLDKDKVKINEFVTVYLVVHNLGNVMASNVKLVVYLPDNFIITDFNDAVYDKTSNTLTWIINADSNNKQQLSFTGKFTKNGNYSFNSKTTLINGSEITHAVSMEVLIDDNKEADKNVNIEEADDNTASEEASDNLNTANAVSMKSTGIPILALLLAILIPLIGIRTKKQK